MSFTSYANSTFQRGTWVAAAAATALMLGACGSSGGSAAATVSLPPPAASSSTAGSDTASSTRTAGDTNSASASPTTAAASVSATPSDAPSCKKVRFALHAGLGAGAVHRWIWKPYQAGSFAATASGRKTAFTKAALAGLFSVHEFKVAVQDLQGCQGTQALTGALQAGLNKVTGAAAAIKGGQVDAKTLTDLNGSLSDIENSAKSDGITVTEQDPSAIQLATGNTGA